MSDDDDYVEGDAGSAPADPPGVIPSDDAPAKRGDDIIDSAHVQDAPVQKIGAHRNAARTAAARKAFAEAVIAAKKNPPPVSEDLEDPEDVALAATEKPAAAELAAAKAQAADPAPAEAAKPPEPVTPPAPSLDPEVRKLREQLAAERQALATERAEIEKAKKAAEPAAVDALSLEDYIDSAPRAYRNWLESMRGDKFASDDEFKAEVADFITQLSSDVLGVPLPETTRVKLEAALARKAVRTHKTIQNRKEAALTARIERERAEAQAKAETEAVEREWSEAAKVLSQQFAAAPDAEGKLAPSPVAKSYPWLAAEDEPGKIVVDVIRAAVIKDGTQLSWQEASKRANDYLSAQAKRYYDKRKPLLAEESAPKPAAAKPAVAAAPAPKLVEAPKPSGESEKWSRDKHLQKTRAAFRQMLAGKPG